MTLDSLGNRPACPFSRRGIRFGMTTRHTFGPPLVFVPEDLLHTGADALVPASVPPTPAGILCGWRADWYYEIAGWTPLRACSPGEGIGLWLAEVRSLTELADVSAPALDSLLQQREQLLLIRGGQTERWELLWKMADCPWQRLAALQQGALAGTSDRLEGWSLFHLARALCPICERALIKDWGACPVCGLVQHEACWTAAGGCGNVECPTRRTGSLMTAESRHTRLASLQRELKDYLQKECIL